MTPVEFLKLTEEDQYLALAAMTDDESRALQHALLAAGQAYAYTRACDAMTLMHPSVTSGTRYFAERVRLELHFAEQKRHRESPTHARANANAKDE